MTKYKCNYCDEIFDEDEATYETHSLFTGMNGGIDSDYCCHKDETYMFCPYCHSDSYEEYYGDDDDDEQV